MIPINKTINKFNNIITLSKVRLQKFDTYGIVYKIDCQDYTSTYIGVSKRKLKKRTYEHTRAVKNCASNSALVLHAEKTGHTIDFNNAKILHNETNFFKRSFSEMLNIYYHNNALNHIEDTQFLKTSYKKTIDLIKNIAFRPNSCPFLLGCLYFSLSHD